MTMLAGYEQIPIAGHAGGNYTGDEPWRVVLHSTEGGSIEGAVAAYRSAGVPPHVTIDPRARRKAQHVDTDRSAYAVMNQPGGVETNRWRALQVEIVGSADQDMAANLGLTYVGDFTHGDLAFIAECLNDLRADKPFDLTAPAFVAYPGSYGFHAPQRMDSDTWTAFGGVCGHEHVPENDHGDPGALDITTILALAGGQPEVHTMRPAPAPVRINGQTFTYVVGTDGQCWEIGPSGQRPLGGQFAGGIGATVDPDTKLVTLTGVGTDFTVWELDQQPGGEWTGAWRNIGGAVHAP